MNRRKWPHRIVACRSCGAAIFFAETQAGKLIPLDAIPSEKGGQFWLTPRDGDRPLANRTTMTHLVRYESHFATCPNAKRHRKKKAAGPRKGLFT